MIQTIDAVYGDGVFTPINPVSFPENQHVRLTVEIPPTTSLREWLAVAREFNREVVAKHGVLPDSTPEIHAERRRAD